jgi:hypothetical protein
LQPGGEVRHLSDDTALLRRSLANQIADHDKAGDAEPYAQRFRRSELGDRFDNGEPGPHRPFGIVFMRLGIGEIDQHPIAEILGDKTGEPGDRVCDTAVISAYHFAQILGIEAHRQRRRADQVAEHDRQLAPLGLAGSGDRASSCDGSARG